MPVGKTKRKATTTRRSAPRKATPAEPRPKSKTVAVYTRVLRGTAAKLKTLGSRYHGAAVVLDKWAAQH